MPPAPQNRKFQLRLINKMKTSLKHNDAYLAMCKENHMSPDMIDLVPMKFGPLKVSARTESGIITISDKFLLDGKTDMIQSYVIHELTHFVQQCFGDGPSIGAKEMDYLKNPFEQEGFQVQLEYMADKFGPSEANRYSEHLLDHHDKKGPERAELKEELLSKVDDGV